MLTTAGLAAWATVRNVEASRAPVSGALLVGGMVSVPANDAGDSPRREARTIPTASAVTAMRVLRKNDFGDMSSDSSSISSA